MGKIIRDGNIITPTTYITPKAEPEYVSFANYKGTTLDLSWLRTDKITNMNYMFSSCSALTSITFGSGFDTSKVGYMTYMFNSCGSLTSLDLSKFNTSNVTDMSSMFQNCHSLTSLDLSGFDTSNVMMMGNMFFHCGALTYLDISSFDFTNVTSYTNMFSSVPANCEILVKDEAAKTWITSKFSNLTNVKVKGGN